MFPRTVAVLAILVVASSVLSADDAWLIRDDGLGSAKIGMTLSQLRAALHERVTESKPSGSEGCWYVKSSSHPHVSFMILDGRFVRTDVDARGIPTIEGIQVGDSESKARRTYGAQMTVQPHKYIDDGHYLTIRSSDGKYGIRFETEKGKITSFYAGRFSAIQYVEGCE
jgi:hypothetical protein